MVQWLPQTYVRFPFIPPAIAFFIYKETSDSGENRGHAHHVASDADGVRIIQPRVARNEPP